jgi:hypothetical protein
MLVYSVVTRGRLMQQACGSVTLASLPSCFTEAVTTIIVRELSDTPRICRQKMQAKHSQQNGSMHSRLREFDLILSFLSFYLCRILKLMRFEVMAVS